ncbi:MAG: translocation/assembly module TamB domain-containing protein, partial [Kiloniellales bacterium]
RPLVVTSGARALAAEPIALTWAGGSIAGRFALDPDAVDLQLAAKRLPLALAALFVPDLKLDGRLKLEVALGGPPAAPEGTAHAEIDGLTMPGLAANFPPLQGSADATLAQGRLDATGALGGLEETALSFALALPVSASAAPFSLAVADTAPLDGSATLKGRIAPLWQTLGIDLHRLDGQLAADLALGGTLAAPRVTGNAQISQGSYENFETGTLLKNLELEAVAEGRRLTVERLSASDGGDGRLTGSGEIAFVPERDFPLSFATTLRQATLVRRDDVTATMSGKVTLDGTLAALALGGTLTSDTIEVRLVDKLPPQVVRLPVEVVGEDQPPKTADKSGGTRIALDLTLDLPQRVFLRGRGLDSEWGGKLAVGGTAAAPKIDGELKPIRGQFDFAGKVFKLGEGSVAFDGGEIDPRLDLRAAHQAKEILAIVRVTGHASAPKIGFESRPPLPQEEILSQVLFGKSRGKLSAGEAVQLASTLRALTGSGEAGILDTARQTLGVDVLRLTGGGEGAQAGVAVGKYLSDQVYVGVEQGAAAGQTNATVEVEITPSITLEGDVGANSGSRVGAKWRWDY